MPPLLARDRLPSLWDQAGVADSALETFVVGYQAPTEESLSAA